MAGLPDLVAANTQAVLLSCKAMHRQIPQDARTLVRAVI
jgi:hypothetical protein